jgi:transcriptional regulator with XRE-family HTH domain
MDPIEIKKFRKKHALNQQELAKIVGTTIRAIQGWEQGQRKVSQSAILLMQQFEFSKNNDPKSQTNSAFEIPYNVPTQMELLIENRQLRIIIEKLNAEIEQLKKTQNSLQIPSNSEKKEE